MSKVNRSTYQKVVEENKRLIKDIRLLVEDGIPAAQQLLCIMKWRKQFKREKEIHDIMMFHAKKYIKEHKDELPDFLTRDVE